MFTMLRKAKHRVEFVTLWQHLTPMNQRHLIQGKKEEEHEVKHVAFLIDKKDRTKMTGSSWEGPGAFTCALYVASLR